jgi:hypothetical protein
VKIHAVGFTFKRSAPRYRFELGKVANVRADVVKVHRMERIIGSASPNGIVTCTYPKQTNERFLLKSDDDIITFFPEAQMIEGHRYVHPHRMTSLTTKSWLLTIHRCHIHSCRINTEMIGHLTAAGAMARPATTSGKKKQRLR